METFLVCGFPAKLDDVAFGAIRPPMLRPYITAIEEDAFLMVFRRCEATTDSHLFRTTSQSLLGER